MKTLAMCLTLLALISTAATAQTAPAPAATPAPPPAAAQTPAKTPTEPAAEPAPAAATAPADAAAPAAEAAAEPEAPATTDAALTESERQRREADRARIRLLLARARAERAALEQEKGSPQASAAPSAAPAPQPEPQEPKRPYRPDDAGAAIAIGLSFEMPWHTERSFDLFSSDDVGQRFGAWATHDLLAFGDRAFLAAGVGFDIESIESSDLFQDALDTELRATVLYATTQLRYALVDFLQPHARLSLGAQLVETELDLQGTHYENDGELPFGSLGVGITLRTPNRTFESRHNDLASLSFGLMIEGGYTIAAPLEMSLDGPGPGDRDIPLTEPALADLDRSGPFVRVSLVARM